MPISPRHIPTTLAVVALLLLTTLTGSLRASEYPVLRVVDGDTIVVNYNGSPEKVRLLCVNTQESVHPDAKQNIPMGKVASHYTESRVTGKSVRLEFEGDRLRGNYGRLLAYVFVDGTNFNLELVRQGLSPYYTKYGKSERYDAQFKETEREARNAGRGIWGDPELAEGYLRLKSKWGQKADVGTDSGTYVGSKKSDKFHHPDCRWARKIHSGNLRFFGSRSEALDAGYVPCKVCNP